MTKYLGNLVKVLYFIFMQLCIQIDPMFIKLITIKLLLSSINFSENWENESKYQWLFPLQHKPQRPEGWVERAATETWRQRRACILLLKKAQSQPAGAQQGGGQEKYPDPLSSCSLAFCLWLPWSIPARSQRPENPLMQSPLQARRWVESRAEDESRPEKPPKGRWLGEVSSMHISIFLQSPP